MIAPNMVKRKMAFISASVVNATECTINKWGEGAPEIRPPCLVLTLRVKFRRLMAGRRAGRGLEMAPVGLARDARLHEHFIKVSLGIQAENPRLLPTSEQLPTVRRKRRCVGAQLRPDDTAFLR